MPHAATELFDFLIRYKYQVIFPAAILEGPIISMISGFLISLGYLEFLPVFIIVSLGDFISDSVFYLLGRFARKFLIERGFIKASDSRIKKLEKHYKTHPRKTILAAKVSYGISFAFLASAGAARIPYLKFADYISIPTAIRSLVLIGMGYYFGAGYQYFGTYVKYYAAAVITVLLLAYLFLRKLRISYEERL